MLDRPRCSGPTVTNGSERLPVSSSWSPNTITRSRVCSGLCLALLLREPDQQREVDFLAARLAGGPAGVQENGVNYPECARCVATVCRLASASARFCAVLISAICVNACGKLPTWRAAPTSYSSANRPTSLATPTTRSNNLLALS